jgi:putative hydrolase of the HAD superfamily
MILKALAKPVRAIFWDNGGVIFRMILPDWLHARARLLHLAESDLRQILYTSESARQAELGVISADTHWQSVATSFHLKKRELADLRRQFWSPQQLDEDVLHFIRSLRPGYQMILLSNAWSDLRPFLTSTPALQNVFDRTVISAEVKFAKPDPRIYELALQRSRIKAAESVFIDDLPANIEGASQVGMNTILFKNLTQLKSDLKNILGCLPE